MPLMRLVLDIIGGRAPPYVSASRLAKIDALCFPFLTTMQDEQRFILLFGPYHPPKTRRGKFLFCEMRGTVKVGDYSDGPIPWPVKWGTRNSLILCGDLVRAVQVESAQGVAHHWGVRPSTVTRYRKALQ